MSGPLYSDPQILARFRRMTDDSGGPDACWPWRGAIQPTGYARLKYGPRRGRKHQRWIFVHRLALMIAEQSDLPPSVHALHDPLRCTLKSCVNPRHIRRGTHAENMRDASIAGVLANSKKTHCPYGHPYGGKPGKARRCPTCNVWSANARRRAAGVPARKFKSRPPAILHPVSVARLSAAPP